MLPAVNLRPPFNITRASHVVLHVSDLAKSRDFYVNIVGLVVSEEGAGICYLRGLAEACHHSLVLVQSRGEQTCKRIGFRVFFEEDLDSAYQFFRAEGLSAEWVDVPHQGRTLHVEDPIGTRIELCAQMKTLPRMYLKRESFTGAHAQRLDHYQLLAPDTYALCEFYSRLGFRNSEYIAHGDKLLGAFMYRKGTCLDLAIVQGEGLACTTSPTPSRSRTRSLPPAIWQATTATPLRWSGGRADMGRAGCCSSICGIRMATAWNCSTATTRRSTSRSSPSGGRPLR